MGGVWCGVGNSGAARAVVPRARRRGAVAHRPCRLSASARPGGGFDAPHPCQRHVNAMYRFRMMFLLDKLGRPLRRPAAPRGLGAKSRSLGVNLNSRKDRTVTRPAQRNQGSRVLGGPEIGRKCAGIAPPDQTHRSTGATAFMCMTRPCTLPHLGRCARQTTRRRACRSAPGRALPRLSS